MEEFEKELRELIEKHKVHLREHDCYAEDHFIKTDHYLVFGTDEHYSETFDEFISRIFTT